MKAGNHLANHFMIAEKFLFYTELKYFKNYIWGLDR